MQSPSAVAKILLFVGSATLPLALEFGSYRTMVRSKRDDDARNDLGAYILREKAVVD